MKDIDLGSLTLDTIGEWPLFVKNIVMLVLALLIILLSAVFIWKPQIDRYQYLQDQELSLKKTFEEKQSLAAGLPMYQAQLQKINSIFAKMLTHLPAQNEMPGLLASLSKTGVESGLVFNLFAPGQEVLHDFYVELPINMEVIGTYQQIATFVSRVAQMKRIVTLHDFTIAPLSESILAKSKLKSTVDNPGLLIMQITAKIYRYRATT